MFFDGTPACGLLIQKWALLAGGSATYCELSPQFEMSFDDDMSTWVRVETPAGPAVAFRNYWVLFELDNGFSVVRGDVFDRTYDLLTDG